MENVFNRPEDLRGGQIKGHLTHILRQRDAAKQSRTFRMSKSRCKALRTAMCATKKAKGSMIKKEGSGPAKYWSIIVRLTIPFTHTMDQRIVERISEHV